MLLPALIVTVSLALLAAVIALYVRLQEIGSGGEVIRISRRSALDADACWRNLEAAWRKTALVFQPSTFLPVEDRATRIVISTFKRLATERILKLMPAAGPMTLGYRLYRQEQTDYPLGKDHFERWSVVPTAKGSRVEVTTQIRRPPIATGLTLLALWRKAGLVASGNIDRTVATLQPAAERPMLRRMTDSQPDKTSTPASRFKREAVMSVAAFVVLLIQYSWQSAIVLAGVILVHEYGHLLSYQLTGKKGNRLMLVPFFGGIAVAGAPHRSEFEQAFCALAGPGICVLLTMGGLGAWSLTDNPDLLFWAREIVYFSALLNLLNLLPIYPLDGGHATESYFRSYFPSMVRNLLIASSAAGLIVILGMGYMQTALFFGFFAYVALQGLPKRSGLRPLKASEMIVITFLYLFITAVHLLGFYAYLNLLMF